MNYFDSPTAHGALMQAAAGWVGTPFAAHQCVRQAGVDCVHLAAALYVETGLLQGIPKFPRYTMDGGKHSAKNLIREWLETSGQFQLWFEKTPMNSAPQALAGDLLCFDLGRVEWHVGVKLEDSMFLNTYEGTPVGRRTLNDPTWARRVKAIWRPIA